MGLKKFDLLAGKWKIFGLGTRRKNSKLSMMTFAGRSA
jgi:hypothetical protein